MKPLFYSLVALLLISTSCKKEQQDIVPEEPKSVNQQEVRRYKLTEIYTEYSNGYEHVETFRYTPNGFITEYISHKKSNNDSLGDDISKIRFDINSLFNYTGEYRESDIQFPMIGVYHYNDDSSLTRIDYSYTNGPNKDFSVLLEWQNGKPTVSVMQYEGFRNPPVAAEYANGNLSTFIPGKGSGGDRLTNISYDKMANPYSTIDPWYTITFQITGFSPEALSLNNPLSYNAGRTSVSYTYIYNDAGLPVKRTDNKGTVTYYKYNYK